MFTPIHSLRYSPLSQKGRWCAGVVVKVADLDQSMPVMNGLDAARELKVIMPHVPLLMFTNNAARISEKEARSARISAVICKSDSDGLKQLVSLAKTLLGQDGAGAQRAS